MIAVLVPPTALSAAHGTETVIMSPWGFRDHATGRRGYRWSPMRGDWAGQMQPGRMIGSRAVEIAKVWGPHAAWA